MSAFFATFTSSLAGMFGAGQWAPSPMSKIQGQISDANTSINTIYQDGLLKHAQAEVDLTHQLVALGNTRRKLTDTQMKYAMQVENENNQLQSIHMLILSGLILTVLTYLIYVPLPKK